MFDRQACTIYNYTEIKTTNKRAKMQREKWKKSTVQTGCLTLKTHNKFNEM